MKIKVINFNSKDVFGSLKQAVFTSALSYAKMYELLHKQIWRKDSSRITIATLNAFSTFNNRPIGFVRKWDIKSASTAPYSYEGNRSTFGLNQLFVGQDYRYPYNGDPGGDDGIYHDDCYICPKSIETTSTSGHINAWIYYTVEDGGMDGNFNEYHQDKKFYRERYDGVLLISNVYIENYIVDSVHYRKIVIENADNTVDSIELGSYDSSFLGEGIEYGACNSPKTIFGYKNWYNTNESFSEHGEIVAQYESNAITFSDSNLLWVAESNGWIRIYEDGTVISFEPEYVTGTDSFDYYPASYSILPMIYLDTGDLAMDRVEFVDKWDDYFKLFVHENKEWWSGIIKPLSLIIAAVLIYFSWGALSPLAKAIIVVGYAIYAAGVLTNNTDLMFIGGILMAGVSVYTAVENALSTTATSSIQLSTMSTEQALANTSFSGTFSGYASAAGMENLVAMPMVESYTSLSLSGLSTVPYAELGSMTLADSYAMANIYATSSFGIDSLMSIGKELYSAYNNANQLLSSSGTSSASSSTNSDDNGVRVTIQNSDDEDDVMEYIKKVIEIL